MTSTTLNIAQVSNRGNKFGIVSGSKIIQKFKTIELAKKALDSKRSFYEYWSESVSVAVDNSKKFTVIL